MTDHHDLITYKRPNRDRWLELRKTCVPSTELAPICGIPTYGNTRFGLWHQHAGLSEDTFEGNERTDAGLALEPAIAKLVAKRIDARVMRLPHFFVRGSMGCSCDYEITDGDLAEWLCEIKNVDGFVFRDDWTEDDEGRVVAPEHIEIQVQGELEVTRRPGCLLAALVGGNSLKFVKIWRKPEFGASLRTIADQFLRAVKEGVRPDPTGDDASLVAQLYTDVDPDHTWDATSDEQMSFALAEYHAIGSRIKADEERRGEIKANMLLEIGDASKVFGMDGYRLDAGYTKGKAPSQITEDMVGQEIGGRRGFRRFVVRRPKGLEEAK